MDQFIVATKPCPFCGSTDTEIKLTGTGLQRSYVVCNQCFARGPEVILGSDESAHIYGKEKRVLMAQESWNHRKSE